MMNMTPLGTKQIYCSQCSAKLIVAKPSGDNKLRYVCRSCSTVFYENPKPVVGCVTEHAGKILLCKRSIEPRLGYWTVPAGFMELGETLQQAAARETLEEACAAVQLGSLLAIVDVPEAGQIHVFFRGTLPDGKFAAGEESLDAALYAPEEIPWPELAFRSVYIALEQYLEQKAAGIQWVHTDIALKNRET
jgi:ADP-ribose pyrophosphatase YjhB (NUDIX family)